MPIASVVHIEMDLFFQHTNSILPMGFMGYTKIALPTGNTQKVRFDSVFSTKRDE